MEHKRAIVVDGQEDAIMTLTSVADLAAVVARAVEFEGPWPAQGGIRGNRYTFGQLVELGRKIRGEMIRFHILFLLLLLTVEKTRRVF